MSSVIKSKSAFAILALAVAIAGGLTGAVLVMAWPELRGNNSSAEIASGAKTDAELVAALKALREDVDAMRDEQGVVRQQVSEIYERIGALGDQAQADENLRAALPPPYVEKVDKFFETPAARSLLSLNAQAKPSLSFGEPRFVSTSVLTVPYALAGKEHFLLVSVKILDYYDLQFDVIWDSMEGEQR